VVLLDILSSLTCWDRQPAGPGTEADAVLVLVVVLLAVVSAMQLFPSSMPTQKAESHTPHDRRPDHLAGQR
jgi:hypothetical protein